MLFVTFVTPWVLQCVTNFLILFSPPPSRRHTVRSITNGANDTTVHVDRTQNWIQQADHELSDSASYRELRSQGLTILVEKKRYRDKSQPNEGQHAVAPAKVQCAV